MNAKRASYATHVYGHKKQRKSVNLEVKLDVLKRFEDGQRAEDIGRALDLPTTTVRKMCGNAEYIRSYVQSVTPSPPTKLTRNSRRMGNVVRRKTYEPEIEEILQEVTKDIVGMAHKLGFNEINSEDIDEWVESHSKELSEEDLMEQQRAAEEDADDVSPRLSTKDLLEAFDYLEKAMAIFSGKDPQIERSSKVNRIIMSGYKCYRELYKQKQRKTVQQPLYTYFKRPSEQQKAAPTRPSPKLLPKFLSGNDKDPDSPPPPFNSNE